VLPGDAPRASAGLTLGWSRSGAEDCLAISGWSPEVLARLRRARGDELARQMPVYPTAVGGDDRAGRAVARSRLPSMAGRYSLDGDAVCFVPRFPFRAPSYTVLVDPRLIQLTPIGRDAGTPPCDVADYEPLTIARPGAASPASTRVAAVYPTNMVLPRNQLRVYVSFSGPMSEGEAADKIHVRRADTGEELLDSFLADPELWDPTRCRLTVFFDPARIKRGLAPHEEVGYPLSEGVDVEFVVDQGFRDARGVPLACGHVQRYRVGPDVRGKVDPGAWTLRSPKAATKEPLVVDFDRPLDCALLDRCLHVADKRGRTVAGTIAVAEGEQTWALHPDAPWPGEQHALVVDAILEDLAGNSLARVFDRDLSLPDHDPRDVDRVVLAFTPTRLHNDD
jgi:hypothetical protein